MLNEDAGLWIGGDPDLEQNYLGSTQSQQWRQIALVFDLGLQDGGCKEFYLDNVFIFDEMQQRIYNCQERPGKPERSWFPT